MLAGWRNTTDWSVIVRRTGCVKGVSWSKERPEQRENDIEQRCKQVRRDHLVRPMKSWSVAAGTIAQEKLWSGSGPAQVNDAGFMQPKVWCNR